MNKQIKKATTALEKSAPAAQANPYRPEYHFLPPANWMNDPNGTIFYNGEFHLFYQLNPYKPKWGRIHWGHAKSNDLVTWEHLPLALAPDPGPKELHCFSGCCVIADDGTPTIFYTSISAKSFAAAVSRQAEQWVATSDADMLIWKKHHANPILSEAQHHPENPPRHWRDPYIWKEGEIWYMVLGGQQPGEKFGSIYLYQSEDLKQWDYVGILAKGREIECKSWECPNYFRLGDNYVLLVAPFQQVIYSIGEFKDHQHRGTAWFTFDHGKDFYATNTYVDDQGRTIVVGWIKADGKGDWAGCLSLPRVVSLDADDRLKIHPLPELEQLRTKHIHLHRKLTEPTAMAGTAPYFGECVEIVAEFELDAADSVGFILSDDEDEYPIRFDFETNTLQALSEQAQLEFRGDPGQLKLHIFIDKSVIEIFVNECETFTTTFHPILGENNALKIAPFFANAQGTITLDFWTMKSVW